MRTPLIDGLLKAGKYFRERVLEPEDVSRVVIRQILSQSSGQVIVPPSHQGARLVRAFPTWLQEFIRDKASEVFTKIRALEKENKIPSLKMGD